VTKKEIVKQISDRSNLTQLRTKQIVQWTFDALIEALETEGRIELRNFGVFEVKVRKARVARNPKTDEEVHVPAKRVVTFQPGKVMEERVSKSKAVSSRKGGRSAVDGDVAVPVGAKASRKDAAGHADDFTNGDLPRKPR
jgi:integration host factor subunit beta